jgi:hypothetical protein
MKLGIIVPYRKRPGHLRKFRESIESYLKDQDYELIVVEQSDDLPFNRGKLLNIGFQQAIRKQCDYVVFHDVDMLPINVDYSYSDVPIHLANGFTNSDREIFDTYFGGVTMFPIDLFKKVNGYSNEYWGWGFEDDDLLMRLTEQNILTDSITYEVPKLNTSGLYLHGDQSYIECPNTIDLNNDFTLHISFKPDEIIPEYDKDFDEYCVFSIPGWDTTIAYNSFNRYKFEYWDTQKNCHQITSKYSYPQYTNITISHDRSDRTLSMYQDGKLIEEQILRRSFLDTKKAWFYIGIADDRENDRKSFRGFVNEFGYWNKPLQLNEVQQIHTAQGFSLLNNYEQYNSSDNLKIYYDFKHIKLDENYKYDSGQVLNLKTNEYDSVCVNSIPKTIQDIQSKTITIPARRNSLFEMIEHKSEGYFEGGWKTKSTRLNQLRFYNEILNNETNLDSDGLSTLKYTKVSSTSQEKFTFISVEL